MIQPTKITDYDRTDAELERFWTFCVLVAGKNADWASAKVCDLYRHAEDQGKTPFGYLREHEHALHNLLVANRVGQYHRIERALRESLGLNLRTCTVEELEGIFGIGPKTARFFVLHSRPGAHVAVLDTHVLRWLSRFLNDDRCAIPRSTPAPRAYARLEKLCLIAMRSAFPGLTPAQADLMVWCVESGRLEGDITAKYAELPGVPENAPEVD
jgi:thermostable 8-oxoguanine DNA glycosylase